MLLNIGRGDSWCGVCDKSAPKWELGYCDISGPPVDWSLISKVKHQSNWGFCDKKLCNIKDSSSYFLKETQLTVLPSKECAFFNTSVLSYDPKGELCAGKIIDYPKVPIYRRSNKKFKGKYTYKYKGKRTNYVSIQLPF